MARAVRVLLAPIGRPTNAQGVLGVRLSLERLGPGKSQVKFAAPAPAKITFVASCVAKARAPERDDRVEREIGTLAGQLSLVTSSAEPLFAVSAGDCVDLIEATRDSQADESGSSASASTESADEAPRRLRIELSESNFSGFGDDSGALRLLVPADLTKHAAHLEVFAVLSVAGAEEASRDANDVLDVPLKPRPRLKLRLVDEIGEPLPSVACEFDIDSGILPVTTDADGIAKIDDDGSDGPAFSVTDPDSVAATLKERCSTSVL